MNALPTRTRLLLAALSASALTVALLATSPAASAATLPGFQLQGDVLGVLPSGSYSGSTQASDVFDAGPGFAFTGSIGIRRNLFFAVRSGMMRNKGVQAVSGTPVAQPGPPGSTRAEAVIFEAVFHRKLTTVPTSFLLQSRHPLRPGVAVYGEGGLGLMSFVEDVRRETTQGSITETSGRQTSFAYLLGVGVSVGLGHVLELVAGGDFQQSRTSSGDVWNDGDNPQFLTGSIGLRYPRY
jgi:hypothetical protein